MLRVRSTSSRKPASALASWRVVNSTRCRAASDLGVGRADLGPDLGDRPRLLADGLADLGPPLLLERDVAGAEVAEGPEGHDVEIGPAPEPAERRVTRLLAAAEGPAAEADAEGGQEGPGAFLAEPGLGRADRGTAAPISGRRRMAVWIRPGKGAEGSTIVTVSTAGRDGPDPDRLVEVKPAGEPGGGDGHPFLGLLDLASIRLSSVAARSASAARPCCASA